MRNLIILCIRIFAISITVHAKSANEAPLTLFGPDGIRVLVTFDGREEVCFLDTGSPYTIIANDTFYSKYKKRPISPLVSAGNQIHGGSAEVEIGKIGLWGKQKVNQTVILSKLETLSPVFGRCILGLDLMKNEMIVFDFKENILRLTDEIPKEKITHELKMNALGNLLIPLKLNQKEVMAVWDTGFSAVALSSEVIAGNKGLFIFLKSYDNGTDLFGIPISYKVYKTSKIGILDLSGPPEMPISSFDMNKGIFEKTGVQVFIGYRMITQYNWFIDLKRKRWTAWDY